jgi:23S rRNA (guanosine2251-2'-O)-methyltransferase
MDEIQILTGIQPVTEALKHRRRPLYRLLISRKSGARELADIAENAGVKLIQASTEELRKLAGNSKHQGAVLECGPLPLYSIEELLRFEPPDGRDLVLLAAGVEDPRNLGAIARCCSFLGVRAMIIPGRETAPISPTASKTSAGALESLPVCRASSATSACRRFSSAGFEVTGVELKGEPLDSWTEIAPKNLLVVGGEDKGLTQRLKAECERLVTIPGSGNVNSLNVSVATGIVLHYLIQHSDKID